MVDFPATNTQYLHNRYEHMNSQDDSYSLKSQEKIKILGNFRSTRLKPRLNQKLKEKQLRRSETDHGGF